MGAVCNIKFFAYNRIDAIFVAEFFKVQRAEHVSVVSERKCRHVEPFGLGYQIIELGTGIEQRIIRMNMKVNKISNRRTFRGRVKYMIVCHSGYCITIFRILSLSTSEIASISWAK